VINEQKSEKRSDLIRSEERRREERRVEEQKEAKHNQKEKT
jgi:hypothetical protein